MADTPTRPTAKLFIEWPPELADANEDERARYVSGQIGAKANELRAAGEVPWFELHYPGTTDADFDALVVYPDGSFGTLPPYDDAAAWAEVDPVNGSARPVVQP